MTAIEAYGEARAPLEPAAAGRRWPALPVIFYLLAVVLPVSVSVGTLVLTSVRIVCMVLIVPLTLRLLAGRYGRVTIVDILLFLHMLWFCVALAYNNPGRVVQQTGSIGIEFFGGYPARTGLHPHRQASHRADPPAG